MGPREGQVTLRKGISRARAELVVSKRLASSGIILTESTISGSESITVQKLHALFRLYSTYLPAYDRFNALGGSCRNRQIVPHKSCILKSGFRSLSAKETKFVLVTLTSLLLEFLNFLFMFRATVQLSRNLGQQRSWWCTW